MLIEFTKYWYRRVGWKLVSVVRRKKFLLKLELWLQVIYFTCSWIWPRGILLTKHTIMRFIMSYTIGFPEPQSRSIVYKTNHSFIVLISNHKKFLVPVILKSIVFLYSWFTTGMSEPLFVEEGTEVLEFSPLHLLTTNLSLLYIYSF